MLLSRQPFKTAALLRCRSHRRLSSLRTGHIVCASTAQISQAETLEKQIQSKEQTETCKDCKGVGRLASGGYHKKNPLNATKVIGSKWTARESVLGWRHFVVTEKRKTGVAVYVLLIATCDIEAQLWINIHNLRDRSSWACGWLQKEQLEALDEPKRVCRTCQGTGLANAWITSGT